MNVVERFIFDNIGDFVRNGGECVSQEHFEARKRICEDCSFFGKVRPFGILPAADGCTICKCYIETKGRMLNLGLEEITCPHKNGNKWAQIDKDFKKLKLK